MTTSNRILFWVAVLGPIQSVGGWLLSGALWPGYDSITMTISDLASPESPVAAIQTGFFVLAALLELLIAFLAIDFGIAARIAICLGGLATLGLAAFPTPLDGSSSTHRFFAIASFLLFSGWQLLAINGRSKNPALHPASVILATLILASVSVWFLTIWADKTSTIAGLAERVLTTSQVVYLSIVILLGVKKTRSR